MALHLRDQPLDDLLARIAIRQTDEHLDLESRQARKVDHCRAIGGSDDQQVLVAPLPDGVQVVDATGRTLLK